MGAMGVYQVFEHAGTQVGGMANVQGPSTPPSWLSYVHVADANRAVAAVKAAGGRLLHGPMEVPGGSWIALFMDPQGGAFAVHELPRTMAAPKAAAAAAKPAAPKPAAAPAKAPAAKKPAAKPKKAKPKASRKKTPRKKVARKPARKGRSAKRSSPRKSARRAAPKKRVRRGRAQRKSARGRRR
jgi:outer membrane biosynthesis protein TonB